MVGAIARCYTCAAQCAPETQVLARTARVRHEDVIAGDHAITKGASGRWMNEMKSRELRRL